MNASDIIELIKVTGIGLTSLVIVLYFGHKIFNSLFKKLIDDGTRIEELIKKIDGQDLIRSNSNSKLVADVTVIVKELKETFRDAITSSEHHAENYKKLSEECNNKVLDRLFKLDKMLSSTVDMNVAIHTRIDELKRAIEELRTLVSRLQKDQ